MRYTNSYSQVRNLNQDYDFDCFLNVDSNPNYYQNYEPTSFDLISQSLDQIDQQKQTSKSLSLQFLPIEFEEQKSSKENSQDTISSENVQFNTKRCCCKCDCQKNKQSIIKKQLKKLVINQISQKKNLVHLTQSRRKKSQKSMRNPPKRGELRNFQKFAKTEHFNFILEEQNQQFIRNKPYLNRIYLKNWASLQDFTAMYLDQQLESIWRKFFQRKHLFRGLMLTRINIQTKKIYLKYLHRFEEAFHRQQFQGFYMKAYESN